MDENVYKQIMLTGTSNTSMEEAVKNAVARASKTVRQMRWFEVIETRGTIAEGAVEQWQVTVRIGFTLEGDIDVGA
jgi:flavin-binding protein dodecin